MQTSSGMLLLALMFVPGILGAVYSQSDSHQGDGFYKSFNFQAITDPSNGRV